MTTIDIDAIRKLTDAYDLQGDAEVIFDEDRYYRAYAAKAHNLARHVPALLAELDKLRAALAETREHLVLDRQAVITLREREQRTHEQLAALTAERDALREVAQTYREAMVGQHQWGGHLIEGNCPDCNKAAEEMDGDLACHQYRQWQKEYEAAIGTYAPAGVTR